MKKPNGQVPDLDGYSLVFEDEFDGDALDTDNRYDRMEGLRRAECNAASEVIGFRRQIDSDGSVTE